MDIKKHIIFTEYFSVPDSFLDFHISYSLIYMYNYEIGILQRELRY